ncbi:MAG: hypothetical protein KKB37_05825, partial [Alphaproteobacteria bacterium]|nr:hypothetical protein [Alphaproteobacteria bacterium]
MSHTQEKNDRIATLLAAYGGDPARWPADGRALLGELGDEERETLLRADQVFDSLLGKAAGHASRSPAPEALMARIMATVPAADCSSMGGGTVVALAARTKTAGQQPGHGLIFDRSSVAGAPQTMRRESVRREWTAAAA